MMLNFRRRRGTILAFIRQRYRKEAAAKGVATKRERRELKEAAAKGAATREREKRG
jgi:hypothetical protein